MELGNPRDLLNYEFQDEFLGYRYDVWSEVNTNKEIIVSPYDWLCDSYLVNCLNLIVPFYWRGHRVKIINIDKQTQL